MKTITLFAALALGAAMTQQAVACDWGLHATARSCCGGLRERRLPSRRAIYYSTGSYNGADGTDGCRRARRSGTGYRSPSLSRRTASDLTELNFAGFAASRARLPQTKPPSTAANFGRKDEGCRTSSRQLNLDDAFGTLALVRDDQGPIRRPCVERAKVSHGLCDQRDAGFDFNLHVVGAAAEACAQRPDRPWGSGGTPLGFLPKPGALLHGGYRRRRGYDTGQATSLPAPHAVNLP